MNERLFIRRGRNVAVMEDFDKNLVKLCGCRLPGAAQFSFT